MGRIAPDAAADHGRDLVQHRTAALNPEAEEALAALGIRVVDIATRGVRGGGKTTVPVLQGPGGSGLIKLSGLDWPRGGFASTAALTCFVNCMIAAFEPPEKRSMIQRAYTAAVLINQVVPWPWSATPPPLARSFFVNCSTSTAISGAIQRRTESAVATSGSTADARWNRLVEVTLRFINGSDDGASPVGTVVGHTVALSASNVATSLMRHIDAAVMATLFAAPPQGL